MLSGKPINKEIFQKSILCTGGAISLVTKYRVGKVDNITSPVNSIHYQGEEICKTFSG